MFPGEDEEFTGSGDERTRRGALTAKGRGPIWSPEPLTGQRFSMTARRSTIQGFDQRMPQARL